MYPFALGKLKKLGSATQSLANGLAPLRKKATIGEPIPKVSDDVVRMHGNSGAVECDVGEL